MSEFNISKIINLLSSKKKILIAGPCSVETEEQLFKTANQLKSIPQLDMIRGGIWKARTLPGKFEGVGEIGLKWLYNVKKQVNLPVVVEVFTHEHVDLCLNYAVEAIWLGARTTSNPFYVQNIANSLKSNTDILVLIKNPINPQIKLWEGAIERFRQSGIKNVIAVHRGFSEYKQKRYRNSPIWAIPLVLKDKYPDIPIITDPSHITGNKKYILKILKKSIKLNFDGFMIESHFNPDNALSDQEQQITPIQLKQIIDKLHLD